MNEEYFFWPKGIYQGFLYSVTRDDTYSTYTFYSDYRANHTAGEHQLCAEVKMPTNAQVSDDDISNEFAKSLSSKICLDIKRGSNEYVECMKTLPRGFFTERNALSVLNSVVKETMNMDKETIKKSDAACCDLMEYAHLQNKKVVKGTGREHIGE